MFSIKDPKMKNALNFCIVFSWFLSFATLILWKFHYVTGRVAICFCVGHWLHHFLSAPVNKMVFEEEQPNLETEVAYLQANLERIKSSNGGNLPKSESKSLSKLRFKVHLLESLRRDLRLIKEKEQRKEMLKEKQKIDWKELWFYTGLLFLACFYSYISLLFLELLGI